MHKGRNYKLISPIPVVARERKLTEHSSKPVRTPRPRNIHHSPAPTSPAAPVPDAKKETASPLSDPLYSVDSWR
jgi:hypothetical protein